MIYYISIFFLDNGASSGRIAGMKTVTTGHYFSPESRDEAAWNNPQQDQYIDMLSLFLYPPRVLNDGSTMASKENTIESCYYYFCVIKNDKASPSTTADLVESNIRPSICQLDIYYYPHHLKKCYLTLFCLFYFWQIWVDKDVTTPRS